MARRYRFIIHEPREHYLREVDGPFQLAYLERASLTPHQLGERGGVLNALEVRREA